MTELTPDELLTTTRSVRKRLDLTRPVPLELVRECLEIASQAPSGGNRQQWHWIVITDPGCRAQVGEYYRRATEPTWRPARRPTPRSSACTTARPTSAQHMGEVPVLVLGCIQSAPWPPDANQAGLWGSLLPAAWSYMLACRVPRPGHRVDHAAPGLREGSRRAARPAGQRAPGRADPDGVLHGRDVPPRSPRSPPGAREPLVAGLRPLGLGGRPLARPPGSSPTATGRPGSSPTAARSGSPRSPARARSGHHQHGVRQVAQPPLLQHVARVPPRAARRGRYAPSSRNERSGNAVQPPALRR